MKKVLLFSCIAFLQLSFLSTLALSEVPKDPTEVVRVSVERVLKTIEEQKKLHGETVTDEMIQALMEILEPVVDFQSISRSVMGKHAKQANDQQIDTFNKVFEESLVKFYSNSLITFEIKEVTVLEQKPDFDPAEGRATVRVQATDGDNNLYEVRYTMRTNSEGEWKVRNFLIEGINVGLTFLNQFDGAMASNNNDIDKVIAGWSDEILKNKEKQ
jgi:phospholipid transport system substrate-binding protein